MQTENARTRPATFIIFVINNFKVALINKLQSRRGIKDITATQMIRFDQVRPGKNSENEASSLRRKTESD
jgi:hypothetical protein